MLVENGAREDCALPETPLAVVAEWQDAANTQDIPRLLEFSDPDIEVVGPRGGAADMSCSRTG